MKNSILILIAILFLVSCLKKEVDLNTIQLDSLKPSFAVPMGEAKLQISRIQSKAGRYFQVNPTTGILELVFDTDPLGKDFGDLIQIPNQNFLNTSTMPVAVLTAFNSSATGSTTTYRDSTKTTFAVANSEQLDSIIVDQGTLDITVTSTFTHDIDVVLTIPGLIKNGVSYSTTITLDYTTTVPVIQNVNVPLNEYTIDLTDGGTTNNTVELKYSLTFTKGATPATSGQLLTFDQKININKVKRVYGFFGNRTFTDNDTLEFDLFKSASQGDLSFAEPRAEITFLNSTGVDFDFEFTSITAPDNTTNPNLGGPGLTSFPTIARATVIYDSTSTFHQIDNSNTTPTLTTILDEKPTKLVYDAKLEMNPVGTPQNFLHEKSRISFKSKLVLPLNGYGNGFALNDTSDRELESLFGISAQDADNIDKITIRINTENELPVAAKIQVYFLDSASNLIDSLLDQGTTNLLNGSTVNFSVPTTDPNYGRVLSPAFKTIDVTLTKDKYKKLINLNQTKMVYKVISNTVGGATMDNIKIFPENYVRLKLSAKIDLDIIIK